MAESTENTTDTAAKTAVDAEEKKVTRKRGEVTIRGRISTTSLRAGEEATVKRTDDVDDLIRRGFVEEVK